MRLLSALAVLTLLSGPAFSEDDMARNLGIGEDGGPPKPRAKPRDDGPRKSWDDWPEEKWRKGEWPEGYAEWEERQKEEWSRTPEGKREIERIRQMLRAREI